MRRRRERSHTPHNHTPHPFYLLEKPAGCIIASSGSFILNKADSRLGSGEARKRAGKPHEVSCGSRGRGGALPAGWYGLSTVLLWECTAEPPNRRGSKIECLTCFGLSPMGHGRETKERKMCPKFRRKDHACPWPTGYGYPVWNCSPACASCQLKRSAVMMTGPTQHFGLQSYLSNHNLLVLF
ncbi:hypothetical protein B0H63DRAFT_467020 [Podospora didyma]|uniref:Uncharacterized protein n=1 Tax=Podospora didyma TaxID=330526 RepID=A0AAE0P0E4_9PEZI|nr:hypothetical protein B0H63DRAFT_467020 [Podospora didyma]